MFLVDDKEPLNIYHHFLRPFTRCTFHLLNSASLHWLGPSME